MFDVVFPVCRFILEALRSQTFSIGWKTSRPCLKKSSGFLELHSYDGVKDTVCRHRTGLNETFFAAAELECASD